ncbi:MAG: hypothetical protein C3F18_06590 [Nitrosomonadales bacterium]|nr:MAG: hypothetical protein C3F18_06590 [Nitrosomonadales bacterium]
MFDVGDTRSKQGGAVMLMVAFSLVAFFAFAALVFDLGRLYIVKSQLQNAADAGALRGARELNGLPDGLIAAAANARLGARTNEFMLVANQLKDEDITVQFASTPFPADWAAASATCQTVPRLCFYIRVDAAANGLSSFFAGIIGINTAASRALAVAGRTSCEMLPIFICGDTSKANLGFQVGRSYSFVPSPSGEVGPGNVGYLHPSADGSTGCGGVSSIGVPTFQRLICIGRTPCYPLPTWRCTITQSARPEIARAFNTRFDEYHASLPNDLDFNTCPPDKNIKEFTPTLADRWMEGGPTEQSLAEWYPNRVYKKNDKIMITRATPATNLSFEAAANGTSGAVEPAWNPVEGGTTNDGGVVWTTTNDQSVWWSYVAAPLSWTPAPVVTAPPLRTQPDPVKQPPGLDTAYPNLSPWKSPYSQTDTTYFTPPQAAHQVAADSAIQPRRLVSVGIASGCPVAGGTGSPVKIEAIGKFFLQLKADENGPQDMLHGELAEIVTTIMETTYPEIRLYR